MQIPKQYNSLVPLTESSFYILISLAEPLHGYGIIQKIEGMSGGRVRMGAGTLYGALTNLTELGLIQRVGKQSGRRKNYQITREGKTLVELEIERMEELICNAKGALQMEGEIE